jgi:hypothetical protein
MKQVLVVAGAFLFFAAPGTGFATLLNLGPEQFVQAGGSDIVVAGYSVPSYVDWNNDGLNDLVVGEGEGGTSPGKVRVYLNVGTASSPQFSGFSYAQSNGTDLTCPSAGCLGLFPRTVYWDADDRKDLLVGLADGSVGVYLNTGSDSNPTFDGGTLLQVGPPGSKVDISVGYRTCPTVVDWDNDGMKDLAVGALDGKVYLFINEGSDTTPDFWVEALAQEDGSDLVVPTARSSPVLLDLDGDGNKDLLIGNSEGQLLLYSNVGSDADPSFSGSVFIESDGAPIDLAGWARSRPFVCDWTGDGYLDVLIGAGDGKIHLYQGVPEPATIVLLGLGCLSLLRKRRR